MTSFKQTLLALMLGGIAATAMAKDITIGASLLTQQHPFYVSLADAMKQEAGKEHARLQVAIANQDLNKQVSDVEDFITRKVDVIVISPVDSKGVKSAILKARAAGIPVITVDIPAVGAEVTSHIATDNFAGGVKAGQLMGQLLNGKGEIGVIHYPTVQSVVDRVEGFKKGIAQYPGLKIVSIQPGITRAEALTAAQNMLQANPQISGIFGFGDDAALAATLAVKSAGKAGKIKVIGFDGMQEARNTVDKDPTFVAVIRQYPEKMGALAVDTAVQIGEGKTVPKSIPVEPGVYTAKSR